MILGDRILPSIWEVLGSYQGIASAVPKVAYCGLPLQGLRPVFDEGRALCFSRLLKHDYCGPF
jgi:hypothetical protein